jgi:hypothetical protein
VRKTTKGRPPQGFPDAPALKEREEVLALFGPGSDPTAKYAFKAYKSQLVRAAATNKKCAYCESRYGGQAPVQIEHFRPKGQYDVVDPGTGKVDRRRPGYWWLASEWDNLLPSCIFCNSPNRQTFPDGTDRTAGKGNLFPLADESTRATGPGGERTEKRLLLNPFRDDPRAHLEFDDDGLVRPKNGSRKGKASIEVYGLMRTGLVEDRLERLKLLRAVMVGVEDAFAAVAEDPQNPALAARLRDRIAELEEFAKPVMEFSEMTHQAVERFKRRLLEGGPQ